ncbi:MAG: hypothetical protein U5R48_17205 [Gammaproteobacteria bacterium]|nr:hypothetical protein [Gammaproteobacteria bacterium]
MFRVVPEIYPVTRLVAFDANRFELVIASIRGQVRPCGGCGGFETDRVAGLRRGRHAGLDKKPVLEYENDRADGEDDCRPGQPQAAAAVQLIARTEARDAPSTRPFRSGAPARQTENDAQRSGEQPQDGDHAEDELAEIAGQQLGVQCLDRGNQAGAGQSDLLVRSLAKLLPAGRVDEAFDFACPALCLCLDKDPCRRIRRHRRIDSRDLLDTRLADRRAAPVHPDRAEAVRPPLGR